MAEKTILVTGSNGQLGSEMRVIAAKYSACKFLFVTKEQLSIDDEIKVRQYFNQHEIDICVNCAAYTAVDKAETEFELACAVNGEGVGILAKVCNEINALFIHISTDYVFDGTSALPYLELDPVCPVNAYGASKLKGEVLALQNNPSSIIIRTSWVYSSFGNNFVKTMLRLMKDRQSINVVADQQGCPTYAADLATAIVHIINSGKVAAGIYHYANAGITNWHQFAVAIKEISGSSCIIKPIPAAQYPTPARRPAYSVMDTTKIQQTFNLSIPHWKDSLKQCLQLLEN